MGEVQTVEQEKTASVNDAWRRVPANSVNQIVTSLQSRGRSHLRTHYALTRYGISSMHAVLPKKTLQEKPTAI